MKAAAGLKGRLAASIFLFLFLGLFLPGENSLSAQVSGETGAITAISLSGLKRTRAFAAERPLKRFLGRDAEFLNYDEVRAVILDTGILEPLDVAVADNPEGPGKVLRVEVREKWSVFPLPLFFVSSGQISAGGFFIDTNAFGINDKLFLGGMYLSRGWMVSGAYMHSPLREHFPGWSLSGSFSRAERHDTDQREEDLRIFNLDSINVSLGLSYPLTDNLRASLRFSYDEKLLRDHGAPLNAPESGSRSLAAGPGLELRRSSYDGYFLSQESASLGYAFTGGIGGSPSFHKIQWQGIYERSLIPGFRLVFRTGGVYAPRAPVLYETGPSAAGLNILPRFFSARQYGGVSLGLEKYLFKISAGTLSILASYQGGYSQGEILGYQFDHGLAGALSFYLSKLAIPALGLGAAYNLPARFFQGSFTMGMSF
ncbi:MAG: hypothetical protein LBT95_01015 [Treponema sp.]|jgi:hypothetical protein|nr:hypothetical protein [Treponema sp.]